MRKLFSSAVLALLLNYGAQADENIRSISVDAADFYAPPGLLRNDRDGEAPLLTATAPGRFSSRRRLEIVNGKSYRLSGSFRAEPDKPGGLLRIGLILHTAARRQILPMHCDPVPKSDTELTRPAKNGDTTIFVADATDWKTRSRGALVVAMGGRPDLSDLPNFEVYPFGNKMTDRSEHEITLGKPLAADYPAGTPVRQQRNGPIYLFAPLDGNCAAEWRNFEFVIAPAGKTFRADTFWPGTATAQLGVILSSPKGGSGGTVQLKDLKLEVVEQ